MKNLINFKSYFVLFCLTIKVQLEMLQMDLEDNETAMTSFDTQVEDLKGTIESLEAKLEESKAQVS